MESSKQKLAKAEQIEKDRKIERAKRQMGVSSRKELWHSTIAKICYEDGWYDFAHAGPISRMGLCK